MFVFSCCHLSTDKEVAFQSEGGNFAVTEGSKHSKAQKKVKRTLVLNKKAPSNTAQFTKQAECKKAATSPQRLRADFVAARNMSLINKSPGPLVQRDINHS